MKFAWDASTANPQPGESFSIGLPAEYRYREIGRRDDLVLGNGTKVGDCVTTSETLTCTFNAAISAATELKGSGNQMIVAQKVAEDNKTTFDANGTEVEVFHPNNERILPIAWVEKDLGKYANSLKREFSSLTWHIQFSGTTIANHLQMEAGSVNSVTFNDVSGGRANPQHGSRLLVRAGQPRGVRRWRRRLLRCRQGRRYSHEHRPRNVRPEADDQR